jgi:hypothetical protein
MSTERGIYRALRTYNDAKAIHQAVVRRSVHPVVRRAGRRVYGKVTGRLARRWFG